MIDETTSAQQDDLDVAESRLNNRSSSRKSPKKKWIVVVLLGSCLLAAAIAAMFLMRPAANEVSDSLGKRSPQTPGAEVKVYLKGRDVVMLAVDEKTLDEMIAAIAARTDALQELIQSGRVITVANGTRARVVTKGFGKTKVRIIEGDKIVSEGWVPESWVW